MKRTFLVAATTIVIIMVVISFAASQEELPTDLVEVATVNCSMEPLEDQDWRCSENFEIKSVWRYWLPFVIQVDVNSKRYLNFSIARDDFGSDPTLDASIRHLAPIDARKYEKGEYYYLGGVQAAPNAFTVVFFGFHSLDEVKDWLNRKKK